MRQADADLAGGRSLGSPYIPGSFPLRLLPFHCLDQASVSQWAPGVLPKPSRLPSRPVLPHLPLQPSTSATRVLEKQQCPPAGAITPITTIATSTHRHHGHTLHNHCPADNQADPNVPAPRPPSTFPGGHQQGSFPSPQFPGPCPYFPGHSQSRRCCGSPALSTPAPGVESLGNWKDRWWESLCRRVEAHMRLSAGSWGPERTAMRQIRHEAMRKERQWRVGERASHPGKNEE